MRLEQPGDVPWHGDDPEWRGRIGARRTNPTECSDRLRGIEIEELRAPLALEPDEHRAAATNARHLGLGHPDRECRRDGGIHGVSALPQHLGARFRGERMRRRHDAMLGDETTADIRCERRRRGWRRRRRARHQGA